MPEFLAKRMKLLGLALAIASLAFFVSELYSRVGIEALASAIAGYGFYLLAALGLYLIAFVPMVMSWNLLLGGTGGTLDAAASSRIFLVSQFAKYLPGNVGHLIGRIVLARNAGVPVRSASAAMLLETVCVLLAASLLVLVAIVSGMLSFEAAPWLLAGSLGIAGVGSAIAFALLARSEDRPKVRLGTIGAAIVLLCLVFLLISAAQIVLLKGDAPFDWSQAGLLASAVIVSWLAGFLAPGAPAGLGVREVGLVAFLYGTIPQEEVLIAATAMRIVTLIGDLVTWLIGLAIQPETEAMPAA